MTILYHVLRITEILVTMAVGIKLLTVPYEMRWNGKVAKSIFGVLWALGAAIPIGNGFWFKFSGIEYVLLSAYALLIILVFYRIPVLYALANNLVFWGTLKLFHYAILIIASNKMGEMRVTEYNEDFSKIHVLEIITIISIITMLIFLMRRQQPIFFWQKKKECFMAVLFALLEWEVLSFILPWNMLQTGTDARNARLAALAIVMMVCVCMLYVIYNYWTDGKRRLQMLELKEDMLEEQFTCLKENYELKRKQIHDSIQQNLLLRGYLEKGEVNQACQYLEQRQQGLKATQIKGETGITEIDVMLHYKRQQAETQGVRIKTDIEVYFCPLSENDICVVLGNLLDNAIEAASQVERKRREIVLKLQTVNHIFLLSIENPYKGKRKLWEGMYVTTKQDKESHGLGLAGSRRIVEGRGGSFQIKDDGSTFRIETILYTEGKENGENEIATETVECGRQLAAGVEGN